MATPEYSKGVLKQGEWGNVRMAMDHDLLETIVDASAQIVGATSAALFLLDRQAQDLAFAVAHGPAADQVRGRRLPLGHGIAGLVAQTGEPIIVADAESDPRHARDIAQVSGYQPRTLLCVPLLTGDDVLGVLELLDRRDGAGFDLRDMLVATQFARVAVLALATAPPESAAPADLHALADRIAAHGARESAACEAILQAYLAGLERSSR